MLKGLAVGYRIKSLIELEHMKKDGRIGAGVAEQIHRVLNAPAGKAKTKAVKCMGADGKAAAIALPTETSNDGKHKRHSAVSQDRNLRKGREHFYTLPEYDTNPDPAVVLYRACIKRWGRYYDGGLVVHELAIRAPRGFICDIALVNYRIAIEFDGYQFHSGLNDIKRDHAKTEQLSSLGWLVFRVGKERVTNDINSFLDRVEQAMAQSQFGEVGLKRFKGTKKRASFNSMLLSWEPKGFSKAASFHYIAKQAP
jgi:hypothetical protein